MGDGKRQPAREAEAGWLRWRRITLGLLVAATAVGIAVVAASGGFPTWRSFWTTVLPMAAVVLVAGALLGMVRPKGGPATLRQTRDLWDWSRTRVLLYAQPITLTVLAALAVAPAKLLPQGGLAWVQPYILLLYPLTVLSTFGQILPWAWPRWLLLKVQQDYVDDLSDELSRQHAGDAFRLAAHGFVVGFMPALWAVAYAPQWTRIAIVGGLWLGAMTATLRFGLLQRAAERAEP